MVSRRTNFDERSKPAPNIIRALSAKTELIIATLEMFFMMLN